MSTARCRKTSRADTTPTGTPPLTNGTWRKPPTAILWIATATGSPLRRITGSWVMTSPMVRPAVGCPATFRIAWGRVKTRRSAPPSGRSGRCPPSACRRRTASSTGAPASIRCGAGTPSSSRCRPSSLPRKVVIPCGVSAFHRSAPQLAQVSSPGKLPKRQTGQITLGLLFDDGPGFAGVEQALQVPLAAGGGGLGELVGQHLVVGRARDAADHADRDRELGPVDVGEHERDQR